MKQIPAFIIAALIFASCQNKGVESSEPENDLLVIGKIDSLRSDILDETRNIWVYVPDETTGAIYGKTEYPVLYLLDGPGHFHAVTGMLKNLGDNGIVPRMVVVGIPNTDRTRDLTPSHVDEMFGDSSFVKTSGGGTAFLEFMEKELIPYVEEKHPVTGYRTLVGHSFGGLAAVHALYSYPGLFANYVAIDPSMWWDDWLLVKKTEDIREGFLEGKALFLGVANTMEEGMELDRVKEDTSRSTNHIRSILNYIEKLEGRQDLALEFGWKYYPDDDHGSVPLINEYDAFRFLFPWYRLEGLSKFFVEDAEDDPAGLMKTLEDHYVKVSERFGYQVLPPEPNVNSLGYNFLSANKPDMARALFELNILNYPGSANVYDSMGDYYLAQADTLKAMENFSRALELGASEITREKLKQLEAGEN